MKVCTHSLPDKGFLFLRHSRYNDQQLFLLALITTVNDDLRFLAVSPSCSPWTIMSGPPMDTGQAREPGKEVKQ